MKLWLDDTQPAPEGYEWCKSSEEVIKAILDTEEHAKIPRMIDCNFSIELIDIQFYMHWLKLNTWLEATGRDIPIHIHL